MTRRRGILAALVAAVLALTACAGLPVEGSVNVGLPAGSGGEVPTFAFRPESPQPGATPEQIVDGFLRAGAGPADRWSVAREYLAPDARWLPRAGVTIDIAGERSSTVTDDGHVTVDLTPVATVDAAGAYEPSDAGPTVLTFSLEQVEGEWRITQAPDGIVLDQDQFTNVFRKYSIMYFDPSWTYLVPDVRWFTPTSIATQIAEALVDGEPSPWLADAIVTAFPEGTALAQRSVPVVAGTAQVDLTAEALEADQVTLDRMQTQLEMSLATASVPAAEMSVGPAVLDASVIPTRATRVAALPLVLTDAGFGYLAGDELTPIDGLSEAMADVPAVAVQVSPDQDFAGVRLDDDTIGRVEAGIGLDPLDTRAALADPTVDPHGYVWSVPHADPAALRAYAPDGTSVDVADAWPDATHLAGMSISRDGTRIAAVVTSGGRTSIWIAGIVRDAEGAPERLGAPFTLGWAEAAGVGVAWIDDVYLGVLTRDDDETVVIEQLVGGQQTTTIGPSTSVASSIAGGTSTSPVRLRTDDGGLLIKRGANWQQTATGILVLATLQGMPQ